MSRAFVSENTGWSYCVEKHESCMFATLAGGCLLKSCKLYPEDQKKEVPKKVEDT